MGNEMSMNISQVKKVRKIVRMKKLATNNSKIFVCTMKKTSVNYRMVPTLLPCFYPLRHFKIYNSDLCIALFSVLFKAVHRWLPLKPPAWSRGEEGIHSTPTVQYWSLTEEDDSHWPKVARTFNITEGSIFAFRFCSFPDEIHLSIYCVWFYFPKLFDAACGTWCCCVMAILSAEAIWCNSIMKSWLLLYGYEISGVFYKYMDYQ